MTVGYLLDMLARLPRTAVVKIDASIPGGPNPEPCEFDIESVIDYGDAGDLPGDPRTVYLNADVRPLAGSAIPRK